LKKKCKQNVSREACGLSGYTWGDNMARNLKETGCERVDWIRLAHVKDE